MAILELDAVALAHRKRPVLRDVTLRLSAAEAVGIVGASGSGKSTLCRLCAGLEAPTAGAVRFDGRDLARLSPQELRWSRREVGYVQEGRGFLSNTSLLDNVLLPLRYHGRLAPDSRRRVDRWVEDFGLVPYLDQIPAGLPAAVQRRA
jgi:ABC-type methionine transport system ATPase subunit